MAHDETNGVGPPFEVEGLPPLFPEGVSAEDYRAGFGEHLRETLNVENWRAGAQLDEEYRRIEAEVACAVRWEDELTERVREEVHPTLAWAPGAPKGAGRYAVPVAELEAIHRGLLFTGGVEACDGNSNVHDTLALTIHQIGVSLVSYQGDCGTWGHRLFRHDLRLSNGDPVKDALAALRRRDRRGGLDHATARDVLSQLARRAIMSYAERAVLLQHSRAIWRMGHGSPAPLELLNGGGSPDLMIESVKIIRDLVLGHQKFVFVASAPTDRLFLTIGNALRPLEYAIVSTLEERLCDVLDDLTFRARVTVDAKWDGVELPPTQWLLRFRDEVASRVVVGVYRATLWAPPQLFYAHVDHADVAARIALADSMFQDQRGFPLLIDLADQHCRSVYGGASLNQMAAAAYAAADAPFRYASERATRERSR